MLQFLSSIVPLYAGVLLDIPVISDVAEKAKEEIIGALVDDFWSTVVGGVIREIQNTVGEDESIL